MRDIHLSSNPIIGFTHVKFQGHETTFSLTFVFQVMKGFKINKNVVRDQTILHKYTLGLRDKFLENFFEVIGYGFGYDFISQLIKKKNVTLFNQIIREKVDSNNGAVKSVISTIFLQQILGGKLLLVLFLFLYFFYIICPYFDPTLCF